MRAGYLPDGLVDTTRKRARTAVQRRGDGHSRGVLTRLLTCTDGLILVTLPLVQDDPAALYTPEAGALARSAVRTILPTQAAWSKLECNRHGLLHVHVLTDARSAPDLPPGTRWKPVGDALGLLAYLSKPSDARACRWRDQRGRWHAPRPADQLAAATDHAAARMRGRLPRMTWSNNLPRIGRSPEGG
ncbi:hypothetical protein GCM10017784_37140 [Deinococcus indicus]|nr:hypothetical protein GCM10017784_37140 [Deinococcus indicus]